LLENVAEVIIVAMPFLLLKCFFSRCVSYVDKVHFFFYLEGRVAFAGEGASGDTDDVMVVVDFARDRCEAQVGDGWQHDIRQREALIPLIPSSCLNLELYG
jgi:hypothetical protein